MPEEFVVFGFRSLGASWPALSGLRPAAIARSFGRLDMTIIMMLVWPWRCSRLRRPAVALAPGGRGDCGDGAYRADVPARDVDPLADLSVLEQPERIVGVWKSGVRVKG